MVKNNIENKKEFTRDCNYLEVDFATGDQFRKIATLRSRDGPITDEQANKFYDEAEREAREWRKNHPGESVTIRVSESEDGEQKQVIETTPKNDLVCSDFRVGVYDQNGKQIVGQENIRKEVERRRTQWEQWKKEGKLEKVDHQVHHTDDGSTVSVYSLVAPVKTLHENEINDDTRWIPLGIVSKKIESGEESQQKSSQEGQKVDENKVGGGGNKEESKISEISNEEKSIDENVQKENKTSEESNKEESVRKENIEDTNIVGKIKKNINEWSVKKLNVTLSNGVKAKHDYLVHSSAKVNIDELGTLIYPVEMFTDSERKELSEALNDSFLVDFLSSGKIEKNALNKNNYQSISLANDSSTSNNTQQTDKGKNDLIVFGVVFVLLIAGLAIVKSRFNKNKKKVKVK